MMRHFYGARIKFSDNLKKGENMRRADLSKNKEMKKYPSLISLRYLLSKEENVELVVECPVSSPKRF